MNIYKYFKVKTNPISGQFPLKKRKRRKRMLARMLPEQAIRLKHPLF